jgi:hypothetical protein
VPHGSCFWGNEVSEAFGMFSPGHLPGGTKVQQWYEMDLEIVRRVDAVVRLEGHSVGADLEVALARELGLPVFFSVEEALEGLCSQRVSAA